jgi:hypothetical protein
MTIYTDEKLQEDLTCGMRGYVRRAEILLSVPEEMRTEVVREANRIMNNIPSRSTEALLTAVRIVKAKA